MQNVLKSKVFIYFMSGFVFKYIRFIEIEIIRIPPSPPKRKDTNRCPFLFACEGALMTNTSCEAGWGDVGVGAKMQSFLHFLCFFSFLNLNLTLANSVDICYITTGKNNTSILACRNGDRSRWNKWILKVVDEPLSGSFWPGRNIAVVILVWVEVCFFMSIH